MKRMLFLLLLAAVAAASAFGQERTYQKEFPVNAGARFSLDSYKGTITIRTDTGKTIRAYARIRPDEGTDPELLDYVKIREHASLNSVSLEVDNDTSGFRRLFGRSVTMPLVDWDITLPDDVDLNLETYKSEVDLDVPAGRVEIDSYKGTGSIRKVRNHFKLDTYKGNFKVDVDNLGDLDAETYKGEITLSIYGARDFGLRATTHKGELRFHGRQIPLEKRGRETEADYTTGNGRNRINLETYKGTFIVEFR